MSWMDSWSRPSKSQGTPPPLYLTHGDSVPYCHTCGRVIGARRTNSSKSASTQVKYCSDKCKNRKPSSAPGSLDRRIEDGLTALLQGLEVEPPVPPAYEVGGKDAPAAPKAVVLKPKQKPKKGDPRIIVMLSELETAVFGNRSDPEKIYGRRKNRRARFVPDKGEWKSIDMEDPSSPPTTTVNDDADTNYDTAGSLTDGSIDDAADTAGGDVRIRPPQTQSELNFSVGGERGWAEKIEESAEMVAKRREGQRRAEEREMVKSAARRAVAFGLVVEVVVVVEEAKKRGKKGRREEGEGEGEGMGVVRRKCEALMNGQVVEPSFAKGDWCIRWRED